MLDLDTGIGSEYVKESSFSWFFTCLTEPEEPPMRLDQLQRLMETASSYGFERGVEPVSLDARERCHNRRAVCS